MAIPYLNMRAFGPPLKLPPPSSESQLILTSDWVLASLLPASPRAAAAASTDKNKDATRATSSYIELNTTTAILLQSRNSQYT
jgi:hypothetical protein